LEKQGCVTNRFSTRAGAHLLDGFVETRTISFGRTFARPPAFVASLVGFRSKQWGMYELYGDEYTMWGARVRTKRVWTSGAEIELRGYDEEIFYLTIRWMACPAASS